MTGEEYIRIITEYCRHYPRGEPGTIEDWILVEDRDSGHGVRRGRNEPLKIQSASDFAGKRVTNKVLKAKIALGMRWMFLPANSPDLNISENGWSFLDKVKHRHFLGKTERMEMLSDSWDNHISQESIDKLFIGGGSEVSYRERWEECKLVSGQRTAH
jgi:hypothetical protein